jgi:hypothetical protein
MSQSRHSLIVYFAIGVSLICYPQASNAGIAEGSSCTQASGSIDKKDLSATSSAIAKQMNVAAVEILGVMAEGRWKIIHVDPKELDEAFLFYDKDPRIGHYVTLFAGAVKKDEGPKIVSWVQNNARGIPQHLADCFAASVTEAQ